MSNPEVDPKLAVAPAPLGEGTVVHGAVAEHGSHNGRARLLAGITAASLLVGGVGYKLFGGEAEAKAQTSPGIGVNVDAMNPNDCINLPKSNDALLPNTPRGQFGPNLDDYPYTAEGVTAAFKYFNQHLCRDNEFAAATIEYSQHGENVKAADVDTRADAYQNNPVAMSGDINTLLGKVKNVELREIKQRYETLSMQVGDNGNIRSAKFDSPKLVGQALVLTVNNEDGTTKELMFRIVCNEQPVSVKGFKLVPVTPAPSETTPVSIPSVGPSPEPTPGSTGCIVEAKPNDGEYEYDSVNCTWRKVTDPTARVMTGGQPNYQDPQTPRGNQGVATQQPVTVPTQAPAPRPTVPLTPNTPPPPPVDGGYNGGASTPTPNAVATPLPTPTEVLPSPGW